MSAYRFDNDTMRFPLLRGLFGPAEKSSKAGAQDSKIQTPADAQFVHGQNLASGEGVAQNYSLAAESYAQAAEQDHRAGQYELATLYGQGKGVVRNEATSLMWLARAAKLGDAAAQYRLGVQQHLASREGYAGALAEGRIEAMKWVRLSASQNYPGAASACEYIALSMSRDEVAEADRRAAAFVPESPAPSVE